MKSYNLSKLTGISAVPTAVGVVALGSQAVIAATDSYKKYYATKRALTRTHLRHRQSIQAHVNAIAYWKEMLSAHPSASTLTKARWNRYIQQHTQHIARMQSHMEHK